MQKKRKLLEKNSGCRILIYQLPEFCADTDSLAMFMIIKAVNGRQKTQNTDQTLRQRHFLSRCL